MVLVDALLLVVGLGLLVAGAEGLVRGGGRLAATFGVPALLIGLTVVAFGTSTPELVVSVLAAAEGRTDLALGNVVGSNIANLLLILGPTAILAPIPVKALVVRREIPLLIGVTLLFAGLALTGVIGRLAGGLLAAGLVAYVIFAYRASKQEPVETEAEFEAGLHVPPPVRHRVRDGLLVLGGLVLLIVGARLAVTSAVDIARTLGLSERVIALTLVAVGTALPELATAFVAAYRGQIDLAVGNVVGSNLYNLLGILGISALVRPLPVPRETLFLDLPVLVAATLATLPIVRSHHCIHRWEGILLFGGYLAYVAALFVL